MGGECSLFGGASLGWLSLSLRQSEGMHAGIGAGSRGEGLLSIDGSLQIFQDGRAMGERELTSWSELAFDIGERMRVGVGRLGIPTPLRRSFRRSGLAWEEPFC